jgi:acetyl-CoA carboxylase carboxyltransferase component
MCRDPQRRERLEAASACARSGGAEKLVDDYKARFANPCSAAERGCVNDVLISRGTRPKVITALEKLLTKREPGSNRKHGTIRL